PRAALSRDLACFPTRRSSDLGGPHTPAGPGTTPSRERIFVCTPETAEDEAPCARQIIASLARQAYRRPVDDSDVEAIFPFYEARSEEHTSELQSRENLVCRLL